MNIQRKASELTQKMSFFTTVEWDFKNKNFRSLSHVLKSEDLQHFDFQHFFIHDKILYVRKIIYGSRKYLLKLKDDDLERDRRVMKLMIFMWKVLKIFTVLLIVFLIYKLINQNF